MNAYQNILADLLQECPPSDVCYPVPYEPQASLEDKFIALNNALERSKRYGDRIMQLVSAFYMGRFLEKEAQSLRGHYAQRLSHHYRVTVSRVYFIFEIPGVGRLMKTTNTTMTLIRRLSFDEYQSLVLRASELFNRC